MMMMNYDDDYDDSEWKIICIKVTYHFFTLIKQLKSCQKIFGTILLYIRL